MSNERIKSTSQEQKYDSAELEKIRLEKSEQLEKSLEANNKETNPENSQESIRHEIESIKQEERESAPAHEKTVERQPVKLNNASTRKVAYQRTMKQVQSQLPVSSRAFSKLIHAPAIEKASEVAGSTLVRPNAVLSGAVFACLLTLGVYLISRWLGYPLSGFETIGAFVLGWLIGNLYDFLRVMITGKKA